MSKRFRYGKIFGKDEWYIEESDFNRATWDSEYNMHLPQYYGINSKKKAEVISNRFNELWDEKEELKKENKQLKSRVDDLEYQLNYVTKCKEMCFKDIEILDKKYEKLYDENKQLQSKLEQYEKIMSDFDVSCFDELRTIMEQGCGV